MRTFLPAAFFVVLVAVLVRVEFGLAIALLLGMVIVMGAAMPRLVERHLEIDRSFGDRAFFGDRVPVQLTLRNRSLLPALWLEVRESLPLAIAPSYESIKSVITVPARDERQLTYEIQCRRRGYYLIGPTTVATGDVLGVSRRHPAPKPAQPLIIYPKVVPLDRLILPIRSPLAEIAATSSLFSDPARVVGVKDYQLGDSPRSIHWTATARTGDVLVKQLEPAVARETMVYLDLNRRNYAFRRRISGPELGITLAASVAAHIIEVEGQAVGLTTEGRDPLAGRLVEVVLPPERGRGRLMGILEYLARMQTETESDFAELLRRQAPQLSWGATLAVISGSLAAPLAETIVLLRRSGFGIALYLVQADTTPPEAAAGLRAAGVSVHGINRERDLRGI